MSSRARSARRRVRRLRALAATAATWVVVLIFIAPFLWTVLASFKTEKQAASTTPTFIFTPTFDNYRTVLEGDFTHYLTNSAIITLATTALVIVVGFPLAYALAIRPIRAWRDVLFFVLSTRMMPAAGIIAPIYMIAQSLGMLDQRATLIVLYTVMNLPIAVWLLRAYLKEVPTEILEAARLDGASTFQEIVRVAIPMTLPSIAATAVLCAVFAWNEFFLAVSLTSFDAGTLPVHLVSFQSGRGLFMAQLAAVTVLTALPTILAGWLAQRRLVQGFSLVQHG